MQITRAFAYAVS
ncbi:Protein of unknown function [Lactobacillus delbrueckii subsp. lactis]|nr:Protein of unknown function [Lactobacillus delbrueckii subsp. lactis]